MFKYRVSCSLELLNCITLYATKSRTIKVCSFVRKKMEKEDDSEEIWKLLEDSKVSGEDDLAALKRRERLRKARVFCRAKAKNIFTVTDLGNSLAAQHSASRATLSSNEEDAMNLLSIRLPENPPLPEVDPLPPPPPLPTVTTICPPPPHSSSSPDLPKDLDHSARPQSSKHGLNSTFSMQTSAFAFKNSKPMLNDKFHSSSFSNYQQHSVNYSSQQLLLSRQPSMSAFSGRHVHSVSKSTSRNKISDGAKRNFSSNSFDAGSGWDFASLSKPLYDVRTWQRMSKIKDNDGTRFRMLSYNVLAQDLLEGNSHLYRNHDPTWLSWQNRFKYLKWEIAYFDPDIVAFQEVQFRRPNHFKIKFLPFFEELGYRAVFKCRTGDKNDGCAIFYKKKLFKLEEYSKVEYYRPGDRLLDRDNIGLVARLSSRGQSCQKVVVGTTHLLFNKKRIDVRLAQAAVFLAEVDRMREEDGVYSPVILTGDFNSNTSSPLYELMASGRVNYAGLVAGRRTLTADPPLLSAPGLAITSNCQLQSVLQSRANRNVVCKDENAGIHNQPGVLSHSLDLTSVYGDLEVDGVVRDPVVTTNHGDWILVDYIFYSNTSSTPELRLSSDLYLTDRLLPPRRSHMGRIGRIPSQLCPSDHFPLLADFMLSSRAER
eukprot:TRINITY_DN6353_c0_g1_i2.p1 TRINITY_DN6353_c0_g1~~TRINITY_DN6353_c0_g1_i2.p1  ORF type:complete len:654 (+),score=105.29 TRINITY_DN6353_c0_g1_i2:99-2060(+)